LNINFLLCFYSFKTSFLKEVLVFYSFLYSLLNQLIFLQEYKIEKFNFCIQNKRQFKEIGNDVEKAISGEFRMRKDRKVFKDQFVEIVKMFDLPRFWKRLCRKA
jgi:hypothetical protein